jgi:hypothetical protein
MALIIRVLDEGEPVITTPVAMLFDGSIRRNEFTDHRGEISIDPCPGSSVHLTINGVDHGVHVCYDGMELNIDRSE